MRIHGPIIRFGLDARFGLLALATVSMMWGPVLSPATAQVVTLTPTEAGAAMGVQPGTATIDIVSATKGKVRFELSGIPAPMAGTECRTLDSGQSLLSGWLKVDMAGPGVADDLVEPWGPPPTMLADAPEGCVAEYPISRNKANGAVTAGCYNPVPNVLAWSPMTKTVAMFNNGMGGASRPDPNAFVSDDDGDADATLRTNYDFTGGQQTTPLVINPWFFGSSVPPFHAQCTKIGTSPAPPVCVAAGGKIRATGSGFKRVYKTQFQNIHQRVLPDGTILSSPSAIPGIGNPGEMRSLGVVNQLAFGRGVIHDIDGPCDNSAVIPGTPCGSTKFGLEGGPPGHPASSDGGKGQRFQDFDSKGVPLVARGVATAISVVLHKDCLTHGFIPGNGPGMPQPPPSRGLPADFVEILTGPLP